MSDLFRDPSAGWAALLVVLLPLVIIGIGELEERLRQHDSALQRPVGIVRNWVLPLFAVWALVRVLFDPSRDNFVNQVIGTLLILASGAAALAALAIIVDRVRDRPREGRRSVPRLLLAFPRLVLFMLIGWMLIAGIWNVDLSAALTALGVTSLVVSFALQDTLGGLASGFTLLADQPFQVGDWIRADAVEGRVVDINWRSSRIQTRNGDLVIVPNGQLADATITNFDEPSRLHRLVVPVQVAYANSPTNAKEMLLAAARSTPGVLADPAPAALSVQVDDPLMGYEVHLWIDDYTIAPQVTSDFGSLVWYHSHRRGVPLPSPAQDLYLWDGVRTAESGRRDHGSVLAGLRGSPLLDQLDDDQLDQLAGATTPGRFSRGETILAPDSQELIVLEEGTARYVLHRDDGGTETVLELSRGEIATALDRADTGGHDIALVATTDCDVLSVPVDVAGGVISRSPALSSALDQLASGRRRRVHRLLRRIASEDLVDEAEGPGAANGATGDDDATGANDDRVTDDAAATGSPSDESEAMKRFRSGSLRSRLSRTLVGLGLMSVVLLATVNFFVVRSLLDSSTRVQLETLRDLRTDAIELAVDRLLTRVAVFGTDPGVAGALDDLEAGYVAIDDELSEGQLEELAAVYEPVTGRYDEAGVDHPPIDELIPDNVPGRYVQYEYIASVPEPDRADTVDAGDGSAYSEAHAEHHEFLRSLAASVGASDLLLVGLGSGDVVYSTAKRVDLGVDVNDGPYADTGLGVALDELDGTSVDAAVIADTTFYLPDSSAPVLHVATAVRSNAKVVGAIVVTIPSSRLTDIVNASGQWDLLGLGDTGDAYVVGADLTLRTVPRTWAEDPERYIDRYLDQTGDDRIAGLMEFTGSPVLLQTVDNAAVQQALDGTPFIGGVDNYLGRSTLAASAPVAVDDLGWVVVTEQQTDETQRELGRFVVSILILLAFLLPILAVVGILLARALARPVRPLVEAAARIADGDYDTGVPDLGRNELGDVGHQLEAVATRLGEQEGSIEAEEQRIVKMLESVLPRALVERVRSGERELAEIVDTATVVSIALRGIPSGTEQDAIVELTTRLADEAARLADEHHVERGQIALEQQIFVAGRGTPGAEVESALGFTRAVIDAVPEIGREFGVELTARAGLSAGLVASGVLGSQQVSFTAWGASVSAAIRLTGRAEDGQVLADGTVVDEASGRWTVHPLDGADDVFVIEATAEAEVTAEAESSGA